MIGYFGVRCDRGGLANEWQELIRHLPPDRILIVDNAKGDRGPNRFDRYPGATIQVGMGAAIEPDTVREFCDGLDTLFAIETFYRPVVASIAREMGVRTILRVNPELYRHDYAPPDLAILPTPWEADRLRMVDTVHLAWPVARDRLPYVERTEARTFCHMAAPAFHDRNGSRLVVEAMKYVTEPTRLLWRGPKPAGPWRSRIGRATVEHLGDDVSDYWRAIPDEADVLLLPRRYGGNGLPMYEAASKGLPVVSLDLPPQNGWLDPNLLISARPKRDVAMVGGSFTVFDADPRHLASVIDWLARNPDEVVRLSKEADAWAQARSWDALLPAYRSLLG